MESPWLGQPIDGIGDDRFKVHKIPASSCRNLPGCFLIIGAQRAHLAGY